MPVLLKIYEIHEIPILLKNLSILGFSIVRHLTPLVLVLSFVKCYCKQFLGTLFIINRNINMFRLIFNTMYAY